MVVEEEEEKQEKAEEEEEGEEEEAVEVEVSSDSKPVLICSPIRLSGSVKRESADPFVLLIESTSSAHLNKSHWIFASKKKKAITHLKQNYKEPLVVMIIWTFKCSATTITTNHSYHLSAKTETVFRHP